MQLTLDSCLRSAAGMEGMYAVFESALTKPEPGLRLLDSSPSNASKNSAYA